MKEVKFKPYLTVLAVLALTVLCLAAGFCFSAKTASAVTGDRHYNHTYLSGYAVEMDINSDRSISVTEDITVYFNYNSGFIRDIPVNGGEVIKNISVSEIKNGSPVSVYYDVFSEDSRFVSIDIGDSSRKNDEHTYRISYDYNLTKAQEGNNLLALTPIGSGWDCEIENVSVTLKLPEGYIAGSVKCFKQSVIGTPTSFPVSETTENGRTVLRTAVEYMDGSWESLRFDLEFADGALSTYFDFTPFYFVIVGAVLLILIVLLKLFCFNKLTVIPVVNFEAPNKMDPLMMGKLIDNKIDNEDVTSMIYYWADKGYIKINLDNQSDPSIIRIVKNLPEGTPAYEVIMFNEMFKGFDVIQPSSLKYTFYRTIDRVSAMVNAQTKNLYNRNSVRLSLLFTILAGLLLGLAPLVLALTQISFTYLIFAPFISIIPMIFINVFGLGVKYNSLKSNKGVKIGMTAAMAVISAVFVLAYTLFVPSHILGIIPKLILSVIACAMTAASTLLVSRTKEYTEQLNEIVGFRNFITLAEKDRLEKMLEEDPEFYYHILPYAQVLGVSDKWEEKFKDITVQPPQWANSSSGAFVNFYVFNSVMRASMASMRSDMVSRPSSSGSSGGGHGSFGGSSGGGHGGGGGRFR